MQITLPTMTFDRSLILHRKSRTVEISLWLAARTPTATCSSFPKEKVLVTGDALHGLTPYMGDSYPTIGSIPWMSRRSSTSTT